MDIQQNQGTYQHQIDPYTNRLNSSIFSSSNMFANVYSYHQSNKDFKQTPNVSYPTNQNAYQNPFIKTPSFISQNTSNNMSSNSQSSNYNQSFLVSKSIVKQNKIGLNSCVQQQKSRPIEVIIDKKPKKNKEKNAQSDNDRQQRRSRSRDLDRKKTFKQQIDQIDRRFRQKQLVKRAQYRDQVFTRRNQLSKVFRNLEKLNNKNLQSYLKQPNEKNRRHLCKSDMQQFIQKIKHQFEHLFQRQTRSSRSQLKQANYKQMSYELDELQDWVQKVRLKAKQLYKKTVMASIKLNQINQQKYMNINLNINVNVNLNQSTQLISYNNTPNTPNPSSSPHEQIESIREYVNKLYSDIGSAMRQRRFFTTKTQGWLSSEDQGKDDRR